MRPQASHELWFPRATTGYGPPVATGEFDVQAQQIGEQLPALADDRQIAAACRGSANPAALAWIAEALRFSTSTRVIDLGAGLGGPLAWFRARYGCDGVAVELSEAAAVGAATVFHLRTVRASAEAVPFRDRGFDVALLLGVASVVDDPLAALTEARRVGGRLGLLDYCATGAATVSAGGSRFPTVARLGELLATTGWTVEQLEHVTVGAPATWRDALDALDVDRHPAEADVVDAIDAGAIAPVMVAAR